MSRKIQHVAVALTAVIVALAVPATAQAADDKKEVYQAFAVNMGGAAAGRSTMFQINITRWSTDEERLALQKILKEKGHKDFMKALRKQKETGFVQGRGALARANPFPSTRLHVAWQFEKDGKREIYLVTDRPISMGEAASNTRSMDYDTTVITMEFPADGGENKGAEGTGLLYMALKIRYDEKEGKLKVEEWGQQPTRLTKITKED